MKILRESVNSTFDLKAWLKSCWNKDDVPPTKTIFLMVIWMVPHCFYHMKTPSEDCVRSSCEHLYSLYSSNSYFTHNIYYIHTGHYTGNKMRRERQFSRLFPKDWVQNKWNHSVCHCSITLNTMRNISVMTTLCILRSHQQRPLNWL